MLYFNMTFKLYNILFAAGMVVLYSCNYNKSKLPTKHPQVNNNHSYAPDTQPLIKHISLNLSVDFKSKVLSGFADYSIENKGYSNLILDIFNINVEKVVLDNGSNAQFEVGKHDSVFGEPLSIKIAPTTKNFRIYYKTNPDARALLWLAPEQTYSKSGPMLFTQSQAILARSWVPIKDAPDYRFTYEATINCPKNLMALMSAENPQSKNDSGIYHFQMKQPISSYLLALAVGNFQYKSLGANCGVYSEPVMVEKAAWEFEQLPDMIKAAENLFGPYRWGQYDVLVLPPSFPFGGMENPRLTFATPTIITGDRSLVDLVAHELAHSWSGNLVTNKTWNDFWLNEGFTMYFENRIMEKVYGADYAKMLAELSMGELKLTLEDMMANNPDDTRLKLDLTGRDPDDGLSDIAYVKGWFFIKMLEEKVGRKKIDAFLTQYFNDHAFGNQTTEGFLEYLGNMMLVNTVDDEINVRDWLYKTGLPDNCPTFSSDYLNAVRKSLSEQSYLKKENTETLKKWNTHQWLYFLRNLDKNTSIEDLNQLDGLFDLTASINAEIQCEWYGICINHGLVEVKPAIRIFLMSVGRRKFLEPLYEKMMASKEFKGFAKELFKEAKSNYHPVSARTISEIVGE